MIYLDWVENFVAPVAWTEAQGSVPFIGSGASWAAAEYVSGNDTTYIAFERIVARQTSVASIIAYDHTAGTWSARYDIGAWVDPDDVHGQPQIHYMDDGYFLALFGSHDSAQHIATSTAADTISGGPWTRQTDVSGAKTYPKSLTYSGSEYVYWRETITGSPGNRPIVTRSAADSSGTLNLNGASESEIVDFGNDTRCYASEMHLRSADEVHFAMIYSTWDDTDRFNVYYFIHDLGTGEVKNVDGSTSVASGSLPVSKATADSDFLVRDTSTEETSHVVLQFDASGYPHLLFAEGTQGATYDLMHTYHNGTSWSSPTSIATLDDNGDSLAFVRHYALVSGPSGQMWAIYPQDFQADTFRGGKRLDRRIWTPGGGWGGAATIAETTTSGIEITNPVAVKNADPDIRVLFTEAQYPLDYENPDSLKIYAFGDSGFISGPGTQTYQYDVGDDLVRVQIADNGDVWDVAFAFLESESELSNNGVTDSSGSMSFDGSADYIELSDSSLWTLDGDFTIIIEDVQSTNATAFYSFIQHGQYTGSSNYGWRLFHNGSASTNTWFFQTDDGGGLTTRVSYAATRKTATTETIAIERSGTTVRIYIDDLTSGNEVASATWSGTTRDAAQPVTIGAEYATGETGQHFRYFGGTMGKVRFARSALIA